MSKTRTNAGKLTPALKRETTYGVDPLDFAAGGVEVLPFPQAKASPFDVTDNFNKTDIEETTGYQIESEGNQVLGDREVTATLSHNLGLNSAISLMKMYFPIYSYSGLVYSATITGVADNGNYSDITVDDATDMLEGHRVLIGGRTDTDEDAYYIITNVDGTTITIDSQLDSSDTSGTFASSFADHSLLAEDIADCLSSYMDDSYTLYLPDRFPREATCGRGGEVVTGVIGTVLNLTMNEGTYSADIVAKDKEKSTNVPYSDVEYKQPNATDGYFRTSGGASLQVWNGTEYISQGTISLNLTVTKNVSTDIKVRKAGEMSDVVVDGVKIEFTYETLYKTRDSDTNFSNALYDNRGIIQPGTQIRLALEQPTGEAIYIEGLASFMEELAPPEENGNKITAKGALKYNKANRENIKVTMRNTYTEDLTTYL